MPRDAQTLVDLREACRRVGQFLTDVDQAAFGLDREKQSAVLHQLMVIGEAVKRLSPALRAAHPRIAWRDIARMRDRLIHHYDAVDLMLVWESAMRDVPALLELVERILPSARF